MGFMDKVKAQAETVAAKAQQGVAAGKEKLDDVAAKRALDAIYRDLGAALHAHKTSGGPQEEVDRLLAAADAHVAEHGAG